MKEVIVRLEKQYDINIDEFLDLYKSNVPREEMVKVLGIGEHKIKTIGASLGLRFAKKHREGDYSLLLPKLDNMDYEEKDVIEDLVDDVDVLSTHLFKTNKSLTQCRDQNTVLRRQVRESARCEDFEKKVVVALKDELEDLIVESPEKQSIAKDDTFSSTCLLCLSDLHVGNLTDKADNGGLNEYNFDIFSQRLDKMFKEADKSKASKLNVVVLGDVLQGIIHNGDLTGEIPTVKALTKFVKLFVEKILSIKDKY